MIKTLLIAIGVGYMASWLIHGKLIKRIQNTRHYVKRGLGLRQSWRYAGVTL